MAEAYVSQSKNPDIAGLSFDERFSLLVDYEFTYRENRRLARLLKEAKLRISACLEDINYQVPRGLDKSIITHLSTCTWLEAGQNILISGPTGVGKTFLACAFGNAACRKGFSTRYYRVPRLLTELNVARGDGSFPKLLKKLSKTKLLILDDWGLTTLTPLEARDILEIIEDRTGKSSTIIATQLPLEHWHSHLGDPTVADAILDRLIHNVHKLILKDESMRKLLRQVDTSGIVAPSPKNISDEQP